MTSFFSNAGIKSICRKLLLPLGFLAAFNSSAIAAGDGQLVANIKLNNRFVIVGGTVTDEKGQALPGVSVYDKKTKKTTSTDPNGRFSIDVESGATLVFSYIGYDTQEILINNTQTFNVVLKESSNTLNEVVAIGYQKIRKSDVGAQSAV